MSNFSFCHKVFESCLLQRHQKTYVCRNRLKQYALKISYHEKFSEIVHFQFLFRYTKEYQRFRGTEIACAEWILQNGGSIRFVERKDWYRNKYKKFSRKFKHFHIQDIDISWAELTSEGFLFLGLFNSYKYISQEDP